VTAPQIRTRIASRRSRNRRPRPREPQTRSGRWASARRTDAAAVAFTAPHRRAPLDAIAKLACGSGRGGLLWVTAVAAAAVRARGAKAAPGAATTVLAAFLGSAALARAVGRPRPFVQSGTSPLVAPPRGPSCPSDHAAGAVAGAYLLSRLAPNFRLEAWAAAVLASASRVYAGVHYPSDVLRVLRSGLRPAAPGLSSRTVESDRREPRARDQTKATPGSNRTA
jgi:hypothetical protein